MGTSNGCLEMCANQRSRHEDKDEVLEALGIGPIKALKKAQNLEDFREGKLEIKRTAADRR